MRDVTGAQVGAEWPGLHLAARRLEATPSHPLADELVALIAERFRVLGEPTRIRLLEHLREGEATVQELTDRTGSTQQNVSKHLGVLRRNGILARTKRGNFVYYRIEDDGVFALCEVVCNSLNRQASSLRQLVGQPSG